MSTVIAESISRRKESVGKTSQPTPMDPSTSSLSKSYRQSPSPPDGTALGQKSSRDRLGRKKDSEWVFRPLKLKFKVKELEHLYNNAVYRQRQSLLLGACVLMVVLSLLVLFVYLGRQKVCINNIMYSSMI